MATMRSPSIVSPFTTNRTLYCIWAAARDPNFGRYLNNYLPIYLSCGPLATVRSSPYSRHPDSLPSISPKPTKQVNSVRASQHNPRFASLHNKPTNEQNLSFLMSAFLFKAQRLISCLWSSPADRRTWWFLVHARGWRRRWTSRFSVWRRTADCSFVCVGFPRRFIFFLSLWWRILPCRGGVFDPQV